MEDVYGLTFSLGLIMFILTMAKVITTDYLYIRQYRESNKESYLIELKKLFNMYCPAFIFMSRTISKNL